jgi:hypothetical protein
VSTVGEADRMPEIERAAVDSAAETIFGEGHAGINHAP